VGNNPEKIVSKRALHHGANDGPQLLVPGIWIVRAPWCSLNQRVELFAPKIHQVQRGLRLPRTHYEAQEHTADQEVLGEHDRMGGVTVRNLKQRRNSIMCQHLANRSAIRESACVLDA
jgi:hypothetical protein